MVIAGGGMRARLYWADGRVEELKGELATETMHVVRQAADGRHHHFTFAEEIDDEGFAIFWEDEDQ